MRLVAAVPDQIRLKHADYHFAVCRSVEAERDELRDDKVVLEKASVELHVTLDALQDEAESNTTMLIGRIQFLSHELQELDADSREAVRLYTHSQRAVHTKVD